VAGCLALAVAIEPWRTHYDYGLNPKASVSMRAILAPIALVARESRLRQMAIASFVYGGVQITLVTYFVTFLIDRFGLTLVLAGLVMSVAQVGSIAGRIVWGILADRVFKRRTMLGLLGLGMGLAAIGTVVSAADWPHWLLFAFASVFGATAVGWNGVFLAEVARIAPAARVSEATGGCLFFTFLGAVLTPPIFNAALTLTASYAAAFAVFGVPASSSAPGCFLRPMAICGSRDERHTRSSARAWRLGTGPRDDAARRALDAGGIFAAIGLAIVGSGVRWQRMPTILRASRALSAPHTSSGTASAGW
jgi:nitrate/nitrite transporter NarK